MVLRHITHSLILLFLLFCSFTSVAQNVEDRQLVDSLIRVADSMSKMRVHTVVADSARKDTTNIYGKNLEPLTGNTYKITGIIRDKVNNEPIPFATIYFPGKGGAAADIDGNFSIGFDTPPGDTLRIQALGYLPKFILIDKNKRRLIYNIDLERDAASLSEFVLHAGEDPALVLLRKIIHRKQFNNPDRLQNYKCEVYNKLELDLQHLSKKQFEQLPVPMIRKFSFVYNNMDSTSEDHPFLPFFLTETMSDYYFQRDPKRTKERIKAMQVKGVKTESIDPYLGAMYQEVNPYDNYTAVLNKRFISPISDAGAFYYKYKIRDTQTVYGHQIIHLHFTPRRNGENCFTGDIWIADSSWALQKIAVTIPKDANLNWASNVRIEQEYAPVNDTTWFVVRNNFTTEIVPPYDLQFPGFIGRKTTIYRNISINDASVATAVNSDALKMDVVIADSARQSKEAYWQASRPENLSKNEHAIYVMMDTLDSLPSFTHFKALVKFVLTGNYEIGPVQLGQYYYLYNSNPVEGRRFRVGFQTTPVLFKNIYLTGYGAYGTLDKKFKYYGSALWLLSRHPRTYIFASYRSDIDRSNNYYDDGISADNIFGNSFRKKNVPFKLAFVNDARLQFFKEYFSGFSYLATIRRRTFDPYAPLPSAGIFTGADGLPSNQVINSEIGLKLHYAYKEHFVDGRYLRTSIGSKYPIIDLNFGVGLKNILQSGYDYQKVGITITHHFKVPPLGKFYYNIFAGKYFGTLPYPLLEIAPGNEVHFYNRYAFNMMNRYEFISDQYAGISLEHNIGGGIFNYIPFLKKAKLRQFWTAKGLIGSLSDANEKLNFTPDYQFRSLQGNPYVEVGTGVENIFQLLRIDFVWRVTPGPLPGEGQGRRFGIFGSIRFDF